jgi:hypothetical protein
MHQDSQFKVKPYLAILDKMSSQLADLKELLADPRHRLPDSDARFQVGGELAELAEDLGHLARGLEEEQP